ncbi:hypothetical protein HID58_022471 [Brassica napus]|uniref:Replication protein A 70 kDa DNA-binding subunit B/D first OB fold domain-containing protein n=1 Tax=Brassica napus TaxID=3708 RepID=A0ABQ8CZD1_BRANA|nr:hypothetical protein HID58_022471 [Brassica napus]
MASIMKFSAIKDLKPWKTTWAVHVKVLHTWKQQTGDTMEIILADENTVLSEPLDEIFLVDVLGHVLDCQFNLPVARKERNLSSPFVASMMFGYHVAYGVTWPSFSTLLSKKKMEWWYSGDTSLTMIQGNEVMPMENNNQLEFSVISD